MTDLGVGHKSVTDVPSQTYRGGVMRLLFGPAGGCADGLFGVLDLAPGDVFREHYHPFSDECLLVVEGVIVVGVDGDHIPLRAGEAILVRRNERHRLVNESSEAARVVFSLYGVAPAPELGHVETEPRGTLERPETGHASA